ncbi:MAG: class II aldolase/adducin family protein, partial [Pseudonocardiaceae bacterium]|nr:class II aldolase/adducin family protein [Pseudonocardiaceae bacterium]
MACRILARQGLLEGILGHVSLRVGDDQLLIRCRGPRENGLLFTTPDEVRLLDFDGDGDLGEYSAPNELPLHTETMRARPDVRSVVHAHPPAVVIADLAGVRLRPVVGAYNIPATRLAAGGIPVYPRSVLIRRRELAAEMLAAMGDRPVCLLRGHGITTVGETVEEAVVRALNVDELARVCLEVARCGGDPDDVSDVDFAELPDLGSGFNDGFV